MTSSEGSVVFSCRVYVLNTVFLHALMCSVSVQCAVVPPSARAAATVFWVEKMLQAAQRHWAPSEHRVSINTCKATKVQVQGLIFFFIMCIEAKVRLNCDYFNITKNMMDSPLSVLWCVCSPQFWIQTEVSPQPPSSLGPSGLAFLILDIKH